MRYLITAAFILALFFTGYVLYSGFHLEAPVAPQLQTQWLRPMHEDIGIGCRLIETRSYDFGSPDLSESDPEKISLARSYLQAAGITEINPQVPTHLSYVLDMLEDETEEPINVIDLKTYAPLENQQNLSFYYCSNGPLARIDRQIIRTKKTNL